MSSFRVRYNNQTKPLATISECTVEDLMAEIRNVTGVFPSRQDITFGYPTRRLPTDAPSLSKSLIEVGVGKREMFTLVEREPGVASSPLGGAPVHAKMEPTEAVKIEIPADNSCLFNAISYLCTGSSNRGPELRQHVVKEVRANPATYTAVVLGCSQDEYCRFIMDPMHWGGYIEMGILSKLYDVEIAVLHIQECRIMPVSSGAPTKRVFLLYDNTHYDAVVFRGYGIDELRRPNIDDSVSMQLAEDMMQKLKLTGCYTDTKNGMMKCDKCGKMCQGKGEAQQHTNKTGHNEFSMSKA